MRLFATTFFWPGIDPYFKPFSSRYAGSMHAATANNSAPIHLHEFYIQSVYMPTAETDLNNYQGIKHQFGGNPHM
jgi:hypothetical protein